MTLSTSQHNEIMRGYYAKQLRAKNELDARIAEVYLAVPAYKTCEDEIATISTEALRAKLKGDSSLLASLQSRIEEISTRMQKLLFSAGFSSDFVDMQYECSCCKDTGYIDNEKCSCFKQAEINLLYHQSNISEILREENFDMFSYDYYSDSTKIQDSDLTPRENIRNIVAECKQFIEDFPCGDNILFMGRPGVGKTFLTNCIAKEILDRSHSVLYLTAGQLFQYLSYRNDDSEGPTAQHIYDCELLIIDDLGTEMANAFTNSKLFECINTRMLEKKSTIISTNYSLKEMMENYSERLFSRVISTYKPYKLVGNDIRFLKKNQ